MKTIVLSSTYLRCLTLASVLTLAACGGGGGGGGGGGSPSNGNTLYSVGGAVVGLSAGANVVLQNNGKDNLTVSTNGNFTFATSLSSGSAYSVSVASQPTGETCTVGASTGAISGSNIESISITCATNTPHFAYVTNYGTNDISAYSLNPLTGELTALAGSRVAAGTHPAGIAIDPSKRFLFVANGDSNDISVYSLNATTGIPTQILASPFSANLGPGAMVVDPTGHYLYVTNAGPLILLSGGGSTRGAASVSGYAINTLTGALAPIAGNPYSTGIQTTGLAIDASGKYLYTPNSGMLSGFSIAPGTGVLTPIPGYPVNDFGGIASSPVGEFIYMNKSATNQLIAAVINTGSGQLTALENSPYATGSFPTSVTFNPSGDYVYVANSVSNNISAYSANRSTGLLSAVAGSPFVTGAFPVAMAFEPSGKFAYVVNTNSSSLSAYAINSYNGALSALPVGPFATGSGPMSIVFK